jgi:hypothetical protein
MLKFRFHRVYDWLCAARNVIRWVGVAISLRSVTFAALNYYGFWRHVRGDDLLEALANRLDTSYAEDVSRQVRPGEREWNPLLRVLATHVQVPKDKTPVVFARAQAITSSKNEGGEWTAPTTPIFLMFRDWPAPVTGDFKRGVDFIQVGTLDDLHQWIKVDQSEFTYFWGTLIFGMLSACVGAFLALPEKRAD